VTGATLVRRTIIMGHEPYGLHMRPAAEFAKCARKWSGTVTLHHGEQTADGTSPSELMMLMAMPGTELVLEADGPDAEQWLDAFEKILSLPHAP
jgi:phosphocarrier protein HPr